MVQLLRICHYLLNLSTPLRKKEPQILIDTTALLTKSLTSFSPFPAGALLVSWDVISGYSSIDNEVGLTACKEALDRRESYLLAFNAYLKLT